MLIAARRLQFSLDIHGFRLTTPNTREIKLRMRFDPNLSALSNLCKPIRIIAIPNFYFRVKNPRT